MSGHDSNWYFDLACRKVRRWLKAERLPNNEAVFVEVKVRWLDGSKGTVCCLMGMEKRTRRACSNMMPSNVLVCVALTRKFREAGLPAHYLPNGSASVAM